jgi:predicted DNA-binding transcriptional regulator YafY
VSKPISKNRKSHEHSAVIRHWCLLRIIPRYPKKITAREAQKSLASHDIEIAKRTIERDLQALSEIFPITSDERDKPYGWSWQKNAPSFDIPGLSSTEALAIKLVEEYLRPLLPASITDQLKPHFHAADEALRKSPKSAKTAAWTRKIHIVPPAQPLLLPKIKAEVQHNIYEALLQDRQMEVLYLRRGDAGPVNYTLHPLAVVQRGAVTYLVATIFDYKDAHLFALHRFRDISILNEPAHRSPDFDLNEYVASGAFGFGDGKTIRLQALFTHDAAEHLHETPLSTDQVLKLQDDDHIKVTATVADTPQLRWWLLGFGDAVEVLAPKRIRSAVAATALAMSRRYCGS